MKLAMQTLLAMACTVVSVPALAQADGFPARPTRMIVPWPPGGSVDPFARLLSHKLPEFMGQQVVVDYRPGASGNLGMELAARASRDGYTVVINSLPVVVNPSLFSKLSFDVTRDLAPVCLLADSPFVLVVHPSVAASSVKDLIALAKAQPGKLHYSSAGSGTNLHVAAELFKNLAGVNLTHIPYKGGGPALAALLSNEAQLSFLGIMIVQAQQAGGRMRPIAVTSPKRSSVLPNLPTIAESGYPGFQAEAWFALMLPAGTPPAILERIRNETLKVLQDTEVQASMAANGLNQVTSTPAELAARIKADTAQWAAVIKDVGIRLE